MEDWQKINTNQETGQHSKSKFPDLEPAGYQLPEVKGLFGLPAAAPSNTGGSALPLISKNPKKRGSFIDDSLNLDGEFPPIISKTNFNTSLEPRAAAKK